MSEPNAPGRPRDDAHPEKAPRSARPWVWILDDSPLEAAMARRALAPQYEVEVFSDGSTLLERIAAGGAPNVLLLDWQLPGMSGIEVCRFLRASRDEIELPILMLTVYGHKADLVDGLNAGANDYVTKPYDAPELAARVATLARINTLHHKVRRAEVAAGDLLARERVARTEAEAANTAKDNFLAMVSHELRTPLNAILGWTRMIRMGSLTEEKVVKALATVERNALAQTRLIEELMDMSRILSGKLTIERQPIELVNLLQSSVETVRPTATAKNVSLGISLEPDVGVIVGDPDRLQQVIWNLLTNAIKFTPGGGTVLLALEQLGDHVEVSVTDSGAGISAEFLPHVFERFQQAGRTDSQAGGGLGLGLAIVKHIIELHGGSVSAHSGGLGLGARFTVILPLASAPGEFAHWRHGSTPNLPEESTSDRLAGLSLLVVDDDEDALYLVGLTLTQHGARVTSAPSVRDALVAIAAQPPDILISDIAMPDRDGYDLVRSLRELHDEKTSRIPALALTAFARPDDRERALAAGFTMYASKPVIPRELVLAVARLAGRFDP